MVSEKVPRALSIAFAIVLLVVGIICIFQGFYRIVWWEPIFRDLMAVLLVGGGLFLFVAGLASFKRWGWYSSEALIAVVLSVVFVLPLIHATLVVVPREISRLLLSVGVSRTLRPLGYASFAATLILMFAGFLAKKGKLSILGSIALYLPIYGYYAFYMYGLIGIGILGLLWLPLYDFCPQIVGLGNIVLLPGLLPRIVLSMPTDPGWQLFLQSQVYFASLRVIMTLGVAFLLLGTMTWFYGRFKGFDIIDFGIYRYSRHPQYLGFLLWSYGLLLLITYYYVPYSFQQPGLFWLISALTTIGVALHEETVMVKRHGEKYVRYRNNTPFMLPLPKQVSTLIKAPIGALLKKDWPENGKEVACAIMVYGLALVLLSALITT